MTFWPGPPVMSWFIHFQRSDRVGRSASSAGLLSPSAGTTFSPRYTSFPASPCQPTHKPFFSKSPPPKIVATGNLPHGKQVILSCLGGLMGVVSAARSIAPVQAKYSPLFCQRLCTLLSVQCPIKVARYVESSFFVNPNSFDAPLPE
jgi:hypothetical protein